MSTRRTTQHHVLIEAHRSYARALAADILRSMPPQVERDDLESAAELGLVDAARNFDPSRGVQFKTFAYYRIRGAVYDAIRKMMWFSRSAHGSYRFEAAANEYMGEYSDSPRTTADAGDEANAIADTLTSCYMLSLEAGGVRISRAAVSSTEQRLIDEERSALLRRALSSLPEKHRQVLIGYYFEDLNLEEVGARLGLSKSWVCRIHAKALELLRTAVSEMLGSTRQAPAALLHGGAGSATLTACHR